MFNQNHTITTTRHVDEFIMKTGSVGFFILLHFFASRLFRKRECARFERKIKRRDKDEEELLNQFEWVFFKNRIFLCFFFIQLLAVCSKTFYCFPRNRTIHATYFITLFFSQTTSQMIWFVGGRFVSNVIRAWGGDFSMLLMLLDPPLNCYVVIRFLPNSV